MTEPHWMTFTSSAPASSSTRRKRAELVCGICHSKKVKCDLQLRGCQGHSKCTNCANSGKECVSRPSKREKRRKMTSSSPYPGSFHPLTPPDSNNSNNYGNDTQLEAPVSDNTRQEQQNGSPIVHHPPPPAAAIQSSFELQALQTPEPLRTSANNDAVSGFEALLRSHEWSIRAAAPVVQSPTANSRGSRHVEASESHVGDVDTGFLQVYDQENQDAARSQEELKSGPKREPAIHPDLQQSFTEAYFEYCYTWCPVLDKEALASDLEQSPLLANALALVGSHVQPPIIRHEGPATYYERAKGRFYNDEEADVLTQLKSISLFYWWAPRAPSTVHRNSTWWWNSTVIRHAQQMDMHREPHPNHPRRQQMDMSLRRRIWWTAFARERLTALCQSKPCMIDPEDCNIHEPTLEDFPNTLQEQRKGEIFIYWVRLCGIIGRIAKHLARSGQNPSTSYFPEHLARELINWVHSLPPHLQLPIGSEQTTTFNRDVHLLYLPYLTVIIILHLRPSFEHKLPQAAPPAILAASCVARIFKDILTRGNTRFLMAIACWYCGTSFIALLQASSNERLTGAANDDLDIIALTVRQLQHMWASANVINRGFERLRPKGGATTTTTNSSATTQNPNAPPEPRHDLTAAAAATATTTATTLGDANTTPTTSTSESHHTHHPPTKPAAPPPLVDPTTTTTSTAPSSTIDLYWIEYFPFVTSQTSQIAEKLLHDHHQQHNQHHHQHNTYNSIPNSNNNQHHPSSNTSTLASGIGIGNSNGNSSNTGNGGGEALFSPTTLNGTTAGNEEIIQLYESSLLQDFFFVDGIDGGVGNDHDAAATAAAVGVGNEFGFGGELAFA